LIRQEISRKAEINAPQTPSEEKRKEERGKRKEERDA
jgi:hypothetical protein